MDDASLLGLFVGGFIGGLFVVSRTFGWLAGLLIILRPPRGGSRPSARPWSVQLVLHSGPWLLALAVMAFVRVAALPWPALGALGGGFGLALGLVAIAVGRVAWRQRHPPSKRPMTPQRLAEIKQTCFFLTIAAWVFLPVIVLGWATRNQLDRSWPLLLGIVPFGLLGGWLWCLVMWMWLGTALEVAENKRLQREARAAQAKDTQAVAVPTRADG